METETKRLYEALFLVDTGQAAADWDGTCEHIKKILDRGEAEILSMRKWDERPLAYIIDGKKRGTYILVYFNAPSANIGAMERDVQLSENITRVLILRADHITQEDMDSDTPSMAAEKSVAAAQAKAAEAAAAKAAEAEAKAAEAKEVESPPVEEAAVEADDAVDENAEEA
ncbi:MAG: 30S ribosomal protein S6 [Anaerohalosphaeraceae bacterium]|nr:30S ribosomal protein S6 [Anaerohalosphaeraceae bacterium]